MGIATDDHTLSTLGRAHLRRIAKFYSRIAVRADVRFVARRGRRTAGARAARVGRLGQTSWCQQVSAM